MDDAIRAFAEDAGIANDWTDAAGAPHRVPIGSLRAIMAALGFPAATPAELAESRERWRRVAGGPRTFVTATVDLPLRIADERKREGVAAELALEDGKSLSLTLEQDKEGLVGPPIPFPGYHRLRLGEREITLAVAPSRCLTLADVAAGRRMFGLVAQLYALRRDGDGGIGDTGALRDLVDAAADAGADAIALSPVHSLFAAEPAHYGPYSPSSRLFLNPLYADPAMVLGEARVAKALADPDQAAQGALIDWSVAGSAKFALLRRLFADFFANELKASQAGKLADDFRQFVDAGGLRLRAHARFEAAHHRHYRADRPVWSWRDWPPEAEKPADAGRSPEQDEEVAFHLFLQWIAARAFAAVQAATRDAGMRVGLIGDLAIGTSPDGSHAWSKPDDLLLGLNIGAPPDPFNMRGQDWGLTGFSPWALRTTGFEPFIATLRAVMPFAGGIRIDHAMGLTRLWLIPRGGAPLDGAYLRYPLDDLLRLVALESHRHRAIVIGEDLGTVPPGFRQRTAAAGIAGMDVLWFQRDAEDFVAPQRWRADAVAMTTTHDLPTVAGWWRGADIDTRSAIGLAPDREGEIRRRAADRRALWRAFRKAKVVDARQPPAAAPERAVDAAIAYVAQSPAPLALVPVEDILGLAEQPNLPGTVTEHPNWRRRLPANTDEILRAPAARQRLDILRGRK